MDGEPITAGHLWELLAQLDAVCPGGLQAPVGGSLQVALVDPHSGALRATVTRSELDRPARRGCPGTPRLDMPTCRHADMSTGRRIDGQVARLFLPGAGPAIPGGSPAPPDHRARATCHHPR
ncbi:MAG: endonuclease [Modestobacter sp.]|nr:endonuclease [Modestobacter sp.]